MNWWSFKFWLREARSDIRKYPHLAWWEFREAFGVGPRFANK